MLAATNSNSDSSSQSPHQIAQGERTDGVLMSTTRAIMYFRLLDTSSCNELWALGIRYAAVLNNHMAVDYTSHDDAHALPCLLWFVLRAFALGARTHTADRAIGERTVQMVRVLPLQNHVCELLSPRWRREIARGVRALPVRVFLFRCGIPRAVRCDGEGNKSPSQREIVPARPCRRSEPIPC